MLSHTLEVGRKVDVVYPSREEKRRLKDMDQVQISLCTAGIAN